MKRDRNSENKFGQVEKGPLSLIRSSKKTI